MATSATADASVKGTAGLSDAAGTRTLSPAEKYSGTPYPLLPRGTEFPKELLCARHHAQARAVIKRKQQNIRLGKASLRPHGSMPAQPNPLNADNKPPTPRDSTKCAWYLNNDDLTTCGFCHAVSNKLPIRYDGKCFALLTAGSTATPTTWRCPPLPPILTKFNSCFNGSTIKMTPHSTTPSYDGGAPSVLNNPKYIQTSKTGSQKFKTPSLPTAWMPRLMLGLRTGGSIRLQIAAP